MMSKKKPRSRGIYLPEISGVASVGECTGLMPTPPLNSEQLGSYKKLFSTSLPQQEEEDPNP